VNRPTFASLSPKLSEVCSYIPTSALAEVFPKYESVTRYLKPEFLDELAESCELTED